MTEPAPAFGSEECNMYLFVKRAYRREKENTDILVNRSLDKLKEYTSRRQDAYPVGEVLRTDRGKPYFKDGEVIFSVSHSGDIWVCLMGMTEKDLSLGVDIQQIREADIKSLLAGISAPARKNWQDRRRRRRSRKSGSSTSGRRKKPAEKLWAQG